MGRGGWRGGGRPKADPAEKLDPVSLRLTPTQIEKLDALGGDQWVRDQIDKARESAAVEPDTTRIVEPGAERRVVKPVRMNAAQRDKYQALGGATWLRLKIDRARKLKGK